MDSFLNQSFLQTTADKILQMAQDIGADAAKVNVGRSAGQSINVRKQSLETLESLRDQHVSLSLYFDYKKGVASCSNLSDEGLWRTVKKAKDIASYTEADLDFGLPEKERLAKSHLDLNLYHAWDASVDDLIEMTKVCEQAAFDYSPKISNSEGASIDTNQSMEVLANSHGFNDFIHASEYSHSCSVLAESNGKMQRDYDYSVSRHADKLASSEKIGGRCAKGAIAKLDIHSIKTGHYPILFDSRIASSLFGHLFQAIGGMAQYHKTSFLLNSLGVKVFPSFVQIVEQPHQKLGLFSRHFDQEGVATTDKEIIKDGQIINYLLSSYSGRKLNMPTTANAGGVFNAQITANAGAQNELISQMNTGLLVCEFMGSGANILTGDYSRGVSGFWVENGQISHAVDEATIAGNLKDIFQHIIAIGSDVDERHNTHCGSVLVEQMMISAN